MMKKIITSIICACMSLPAFAFNKAGSVPVSVGGGYYYFASKRHMDNAGIGIARVGYNFTDTWGIEGLLGFMNSKSRRAVDNNKQVNGNLFAIDVAYHFQPIANAWQPYLQAGPGIIGLSPNGYDSRNEGLFNVAAGLKYFPGAQMAFGVEGAGLYTFVGGKLDYMINGYITYLFNAS